MPSLLIKEGPSSGQTLAVDSELVLGRENADLTIEDLELSRHHARIRTVNGTLEIEDLGSLNGTWVNGARIPEPTLLKPGDQVKLGLTLIEVLADPTPQRDDTVAQRTVMRPSDHPDVAPEPPAPPPAPPPSPAFPREPAERREPDDWLRPEPLQPAEPIRPVEPTPPVERIPAVEPGGRARGDARQPGPVWVPARAGRWSLEWIAAMSVIPFVVFSIGANALPGATPLRGASQKDYLKFFADHQGRITIAFILITIGAAFYLLYFGVLWRTFRNAEGDDAWLSTVLLVSAAGMAALSVADNAFWGAAALRSHKGLSPDLARTLFDLGSIFYMPWLPLVVFLFAAAALIFRTEVFSRRLGWTAAIACPLVLLEALRGEGLRSGGFASVLVIIGHIGLAAWVIWTLITGIIMARRFAGASRQNG